MGIKQIAIYCAGGLGREVACLINAINRVEHQWDIIGYFDDVKAINSTNEYGMVLGGIYELNKWKDKLSIVVANGNPKALKKIVAAIENPLIDFPNIIAPDFVVLDNQNYFIGKGNIITWHCGISCNVRLGDFNLLNGYNSFGHDAKIGSYNSFMPSVKVSGNVIIGDCNFWGTASVVIENVHVGNNVRVGAGSVVMRRTQDGTVYVGNPAVKVNF